MFTRPASVVDRSVGGVLARGWAVVADDVTWQPIGFGSHHWIATAGATRWFVTVDDLEVGRRADESRAEPLGRLAAALSTARALRDGGLDFVVAPVPAASGDVLEPIDDRHVAALYPYIEGGGNPWGPYPSARDRNRVVARLAQLHGSTVRAGAHRDDLGAASEGMLLHTLDGLDRAWTGGPYGERARRAIARVAPSIRRAMTRRRELAASPATDHGRMVITHGEPHPGNTIDTPDGPQLIDWDTLRIAPPERDLWSLVDEDDRVADRYEADGGIPVDERGLELYRLAWDLAEVAAFAEDFRGTHADDDDARTGWQGLTRSLDRLAGS